MARYVVPVVVLLALVGGYVVGQQPAAKSGDELKPVDEPLKGDLGERVDDGFPPALNVFYDVQPGVFPGDSNQGGKVDLSDTGIAKPQLGSAVRPAFVVGRYVPFEGGKMLDTTTGTLYAVSGDNRWKPVARVETDDATALDKWSDDTESTIASRQLALEVVKRALLTHPSGNLEAVAKQLESSIESSIKELELRGPTKLSPPLHR